MKAIARSLVVIFVALIAVPALAVSVTITTAVQLLAVTTTAFFLGGTQHPLSTPPDDPTGFINPYMNQAINNFIVPAGAGPVDKRVAVIYSAEVFPLGSDTLDASVEGGVENLGSCLDSSPLGCAHNENFDDPPTPGEGEHFIIFGYSQGAVVASLVKNDLINDPTPDPALDGTEIFAASNPMRPNGGILARGFKGLTIPFVGITFYGPTENSCPDATPCSPTPDTTDPNIYPTVDVAQQYDLLGGDAPAVPWNLLAWANSFAAYSLLHGDVPSQSLDGDNVVDQGQYGDTHYYLLTSDLLPLLVPLERAGVPKSILLVANAPLQVLVEAGYYREPSPGENVPFQLLPEKDPITLAVNVLKSIPVGIDDGLEEAGVGRALGTEPAGPFGVGGPSPDENMTLNVASEGAPAPELKLPLEPSPGPELKLVPEEPKAPEQPQGGGTEKITSESGLTKLDTNPIKLGNRDISTPDTPLAGIKPRPFQLLRDPIKFDPPKLPSAVRPSGDGPLKRIVNALTGQRPDPAGETGQGEDPEPAQGVKSEDDAA